MVPSALDFKDQNGIDVSPSIFVEVGIPPSSLIVHTLRCLIISLMNAPYCAADWDKLTPTFI